MSRSVRQRIAQSLAVLACLLLLPAMAATWIASVATQTDDYVRTVGPLARDQAVRNAVSDRVAQAVITKLAQNKPEGIDASAFEEQLQSAVSSVVNKAISSEEFATVWTEANRRAHATAVAIMEANNALRDQDVVAIDLTALAQDVVDQVAEILDINRAVLAPRLTYQLLDAEQLERARFVYQLLQDLGYWLPIAVLALAVAALLVGARRSRVASTLAFGSAIVLALTSIALFVGKSWAVGQVPLADQEIADAVIDQLTQQAEIVVWSGMGLSLVAGIGLKLLSRNPADGGADA